ncbi:3453_t:CDS:2 [Diversispora eburnea]|uniref:3453_t:CDS:1 n=1 Tax=Diversispora eburnea TaxID=1213867 RepID=A0A9N8WKD3_9GLOM|nr:3453_t:CDS:2 [Diversispora eburnea]
MVPTALPLKVQGKCDEFVSTFIENCAFDLSQKLLHDGIWKETNTELSYVAKRILNTLQK